MDGMDGGMVEVGKGRTGNASSRGAKMAEELEGGGRDIGERNALAVPGQVDQTFKPGLGRIEGRKLGGLRNWRRGGGGVGEGVDGGGDQGRGVGDVVVVGGHRTSNNLDEMTNKLDHQRQDNSRALSVWVQLKTKLTNIARN